MTSTLLHKLGATFFGGLLLIMAACIAEAGSLDRQGIEQNLIGKTLVGQRMVMTVRLTLRGDGGLEVEAPMGQGQGSWQIEGESLCFDTPRRPPSGQRCQQFQMVEPAGGYSRVESSTGMIFQIE